jgi:predicted nucleic acid-binding protein
LRVLRYRAFFSERVVVTDQICQRALELRLASAKRLPAVDSLIAATASVHGAILVHRDPHFLDIPKELLSQEMLPPK